eukprot:scaffold1996_cov127-Cylindrotheca_fusiformis.AAC.15
MDELAAEIDAIDEIPEPAPEPQAKPAPWSQETATKRPSKTSNEQSNLFEKLKEYETKRRSVYSSKWDSMSLYWKSYKDLLSASLQETGRAERLVLGTCRAHQQYSNAMKAIHDDTFLDEKGNVANEKQQKRLAAARKNQGPKSKAQSITVVREIQQSHRTLANRFGENAKNMDQEIAETIQSLYRDLKTQFSGMERLGTSIIEELEKTEQEVTKAWGTYIKATALSNDPPQTPSPRNNMSPQEASKKRSDSDPWIVEMQYRVAVAYQNTAWDKGNAELTKLFATVKQEECARRMHLREFLVAFVQRQQRLFLSLPGIHNAVLEELVGKEISLDEVQRSVEKAIETRAAKYHADLEVLSQNAALSAENSQQDNVDSEKLGSPLFSDLLTKAKVIERRVKGTGTSAWQTSLAIITVDSFLHLFDIESKSIIPGSSPEIAFKTLVPTAFVPSSANLAAGKTNFSRGWGDSITPSDSMVLANCSLQRRDETSFELTETITPTGASKMFGKIMIKRVLINTSTKEEADDWIALLTS